LERNANLSTISSSDVIFTCACVCSFPLHQQRRPHKKGQELRLNRSGGGRATAQAATLAEEGGEGVGRAAEAEETAAGLEGVLVGEATETIRAPSMLRRWRVLRLPLLLRAVAPS